MVVKTEAEETIAEEENSEGKDISLAFRPKKANSERVHLRIMPRILPYLYGR